MRSKFENFDFLRDCQFCGRYGFKGSGVQGCILAHRLHLGCVFTRKASTSSGQFQNLEPNWQLFGKISIFNEDFGYLMPSLSLTLNVEPLAQTGVKYERLLSNGRTGLGSPKCTKAVVPGQA